ncbi:MAG TPA: rRNA maturation RNase YbeY [Candidimonas sp.]|nr:rRNA maturation RNase YbeY [Candidimonas sp.]
MSPDLSFSVQYATPAPELPRWRLRAWARHAINGIARARSGRDAESAMPPFKAAALTLRLVDEEEGRALNRDYRQRDYATNVLTFEYGIDPDGIAHGDIVLCVPVLLREAREQNKTLLHHAAHLTLHGVLHALGYDHIEPDEASQMEAIEIEILRKLGIPDPYQA